MPATYEPIASANPSSATSVSFSSIPDTYTDLVLVAALTQPYGFSEIQLRFNGSSATNYSATYVKGDGSSASSNRWSNANAMNLSTNGPGNSSTPLTLNVAIQRYASTSVFKTVLSASGSASQQVDRLVGLWRSTSAITSIDLFPVSWNITGTVSLYGIKAA